MIVTKEFAKPISDDIVKALKASDRSVKITRYEIWAHRLEVAQANDEVHAAAEEAMTRDTKESVFLGFTLAALLGLTYVFVWYVGTH